ncbi:MAG TPA: dihydroorotase [Candidatus Limnocylindria bacterium]|jgi:dihydroorotase|nr:dihydroorotase [Candidatus Limnocylindria bacterium]
MSSFGSLDDPAATFVLAGARIVDPSTDEDAIRDLAVVDGQLVEPATAPADAARFEGRGLVVGAGLCDLHVHLREPGMERAETIESGARAAAHGGFTTVCAMPNTDPPLDEPARVAMVLDRARNRACRVRVIAAATRGREGERITEVGELAGMGIAGVSDDGSVVASARVARGLLAYLAPLGLPLIEHAEDPALSAGSVMRAGETATRLGLAGWPPSAELSMVERDIALAQETGGWVHITHLSTAGGLDAIRRAKQGGIRVTCDVTPHHLALTDAWVAGWRGFAWDEPTGVAADPFGAPLDALLAYDPACRVNPPLASRADALALLAGVADGTIDAIATDHAPHPRERKGVEFGAAAPGMIGLETALSLGLAAVEAGRLQLPRLLEALATRPAKLIGEVRTLQPGSVADLVVFDPAARWRVEASGLASASSNTPLLGMELPGVVRMTVAGGRITYREGLGAGG